MKSRGLLFWAGVALALGALGCATAETGGEDDGDTTSTVAGPGGAAGTGGQGGSGGEISSPCALDCSTIDTPDCQHAVCNPATKQCEVQPLPDGDPCDDGMFCTVDDGCMAGNCTGGPPNDCGEQPGPCQEVVCDETTKSCSFSELPVGTNCMPTDLCQLGATCTAGGQCIGTPNDCFFAPVPDDCHVAVCNPMNGMCEPQPGNEAQPCTDLSDLCSVGNTCTAGVCGGGGPKDCSSLSVGCNNGVCDTTTGQCVAQPLMPGQMCAEATDDCNQGYCDMNGVCVPTPVNPGGMCDDGLSCTTGTTCTNGVCAGGTSTITVYLFEDFASNAAGWTLDTTWQIAPAMSSAPTPSCGNGDPGQDHTATTDNGIAGVVVGGNVMQSVTNGFRWLTSPIINTASAPSVWLEYRRWLNSDYPNFMTNKVQVFNGTSWVDVWVQPSNSTVISDSSWTYHSYDLTPHKNTQMRVRFGYEIGSTGVYLCSSWNLDDVLIASGVCGP